MSVTGSYKAL